VEEREGEGGDGGKDCRDLVIWGSGWRKTSVFAMSLSQNISLRDELVVKHQFS